MAPKRAPPAAKAEPKRGGKAAAPPPPEPRTRGGKAAAAAPPAEAPPPKRGGAKASAQPPPAPAQEIEDYSSWSVQKLKDKLKELGLTATGGKESLIERLKALAPAAAAAGGGEKRKAADDASVASPAATAAKTKRTAAAEENEEETATASAKAGGSAGKRKGAPQSSSGDAAAAKSSPKKAKAAAKSAASEPVPEIGIQQSAIASSGPVPESQVVYEDGEFKAEYAKSNRSTCKTCNEIIQTQAMRIGKMVPSDKFDGKIPLWHHAACFLNGGLLPRSTELIGGFSMLRPEDQDVIRKRVPSGGAAASSGAGSSKDPIQLQNKRIFEIHDALGQLDDNQIKEMLVLNGYPDKKLRVRATMRELCADGIIFGATEKCEECNSDRGHVLLNGERYECIGWVNEFLRCTFRTQTPRRTVWQLTEAAKEISVFKKMKLTKGKRLFASKMVDQDDEAVDTVLSTQKQPPLVGLLFAIVGSLDTMSKSDFIELVRKHGGNFTESITRATSCVVSTVETAEEAPTEVATAKECEVPGVSEDFLKDSVKEGEPQDMTPYLLWGEARSRKKAIEETVTSRLIEKRGVMIDSEVGELKDTAHVLVDKAKGRVYSEMLSKTDMVSGANSFYTMHLLESDDASDVGQKYWVFRKWGRIGVNQGGTKLEEFGTNKDKAIQNFSKNYLDKTGNTFGHKPAEFQVVKGLFTRIDVQHKKGSGGQGGDGGGEADQPLGKLSKAQIEKGDAVLDKIEALFSEVPIPTTQFHALSAEYYTLIPHNFGMKRPPVINNADLHGAEKALLQFYLRMGFEEVGGEDDEKLTPISGVMQLEVPKSLAQSATGVCDAKAVKGCDTKAQILAKKQAGKPTKHMAAPFYGSILLYTANAIYKQLNKALRDEDRAQIQKYFPYLRLLFEACSILPSKKKTLWRGLGVDLYSQYKEGSEVIWWGVSSCTSEKKVAMDFMNGCGDGATFLTVETESAVDISELSFYSNEAESILLPGTKLKVLKSEKKGNKAFITLQEVGRVVS